MGFFTRSSWFQLANLLASSWDRQRSLIMQTLAEFPQGFPPAGASGEGESGGSGAVVAEDVVGVVEAAVEMLKGVRVRVSVFGLDLTDVDGNRGL